MSLKHLTSAELDRMLQDEYHGKLDLDRFRAILAEFSSRPDFLNQTILATSPEPVTLTELLPVCDHCGQLGHPGEC